ncbi:hypothetical protein D3Z38_02070 [Clostridiales bacterium]|nr:hypothetical protein [Clostridiales bacterium]
MNEKGTSYGITICGLILGLFSMRMVCYAMLVLIFLPLSKLVFKKNQLKYMEVITWEISCSGYI